MISNMYLIGLQLHGTKREWKLILIRPRYCVSAETQALYTASNALPQVEKFKYLIVVFTSDVKA